MTGPFWRVGKRTRRIAFAGIITVVGLTGCGSNIQPFTPFPTAATPVFSPGGGTFTSPQMVSISEATDGAEIYYTTNGTAPTTRSGLYNGLIAVSSPETVEAIAVASGYTNSPVASATYMIALPVQVAIPTFTPPAGSYTTAQSVILSDTTPGAEIYFTTNGATPTANSTPYSGSIAVSSSETVSAIAAASSSLSAVASATYSITLPVVATPTFSPAAGSYAGAQSVTIIDATTGATIYYTTDGTTPSTSATLYSGAITVSSSETIEAIAIEAGYTNSNVASAAYSITVEVDGRQQYGRCCGSLRKPWHTFRR